MSKPCLAALIACTLAIPLSLTACSSKCCARKAGPAPVPASAPAAGAGGCVRPPGPSVPIDPSAPPPVPTPPASPTKAAEAAAAAPAPVQAPAAEVAADKPSNMFCPVVMGEPIDPTITTVWQGKTVGFCSVMAKQKFLKSPEKYAKNLP